MKGKETPNSYKPLAGPLQGFLSPPNPDFSNPSAHELLLYAQTLESLSKISPFQDFEIRRVSEEICKLIKSRVKIKEGKKESK